MVLPTTTAIRLVMVELAEAHQEADGDKNLKLHIVWDTRDTAELAWEQQLITKMDITDTEPWVDQTLVAAEEGDSIRGLVETVGQVL